MKEILVRNPSVAYLIVRVESKVIFKRGRYTEKNEYLLIAGATGRYRDVGTGPHQIFTATSTLFQSPGTLYVCQLNKLSPTKNFEIPTGLDGVTITTL